MVKIIIELMFVMAVAAFLVNSKLKLKKRHQALKKSYDRLVKNYAAILKRVDLYERALIKHNCTQVIEDAANTEIEENNL